MFRITDIKLHLHYNGLISFVDNDRHVQKCVFITSEM